MYYNFKLPYHEFNINGNNNNTINLIYCHNPNTHNVILLSHGNAGNIKRRIPFIYKFIKYASIVIYDYRGYGKSTGSPTESGVYEDIELVYNYLINNIGIMPYHITFYGISLCSSIGQSFNLISMSSIFIVI
jgi:hypothetical protein